MTIKPLDELLEHELLVHSGTDEEFSNALNELELNPTRHKLMALYYSGVGLKFMLFENEGLGYLRLQGRGDKSHSDIKERFYNELEVNGLNFNDFIRRGGGDVKAKRKDGKTTLYFSGSSGDYGEFNTNLLRQVLENHLDKRIGYKIY